MATLKEVILESIPVAYFPLDDINNLGRDDSISGMNGTQSGTFELVKYRGLDGIYMDLIKGVSSPLVVIPDRDGFKGNIITIELILSNVSIGGNLVLFERGIDNKNWSLQDYKGTSTNSVVKFSLGTETTPSLNEVSIGGTQFSPVHMIITSNNGGNKSWINGILNSDSTAGSTGIQNSQGDLPVYLFSRNGLGQTTSCISNVAVYDRELTNDEITARINALIPVLDIKEVKPCNATWSNKETREQANPYPPAMQNVKPIETIATLLGKSGNYQTLLNQKGEQRPVGYYQSTVMINKVPTAGKRVFCFTNNGQLRDETVSDVNGIYRFDHLDMNEKYMFVAQESNDRKTPPEYNAVASDWQTPTKYGE